MVEEKKIVDTTTLDILFEKKVLEEMDFIKLDTQGAELDILMGGEKLLDEKILGVQVEVEFKRECIGHNPCLLKLICSFVTNLDLYFLISEKHIGNMKKVEGKALVKDS